MWSLKDSYKLDRAELYQSRNHKLQGFVTFKSEVSAHNNPALLSQKIRNCTL